MNNCNYKTDKFKKGLESILSAIQKATYFFRYSRGLWTVNNWVQIQQVYYFW